MTAEYLICLAAAAILLVCVVVVLGSLQRIEDRRASNTMVSSPSEPAVQTPAAASLPKPVIAVAPAARIIGGSSAAPVAEVRPVARTEARSEVPRVAKVQQEPSALARPGAMSWVTGVSIVSADQAGYAPASNLTSGDGFTCTGKLTGTHSRSADAENLWRGNRGTPSPTNPSTIVFDLGGSYTLDCLDIWNGNGNVNRGVKDLEVLVSNTGTESGSFRTWSKLVLTAADGSTSYAGQHFQLPAAQGRYVKFVITSNQQSFMLEVEMSKVRFGARSAVKSPALRSDTNAQSTKVVPGT